jgi:hypothetical protein
MTDDDTAAGAAETTRTMTETDELGNSVGHSGSEEEAGDALWTNLLALGLQPLDWSGDSGFLLRLRLLSNFPVPGKDIGLGPTLVGLDAERRRNFYKDVGHELGALLIEALTEAGQGSAALRIQKMVKAALTPAKRGRKGAWTAQDRGRVIADLLRQTLENRNLSATAVWKELAKDPFWEVHQARMGSKGPIYRHLQEGAKGFGKEIGRPLFKDAAGMTRIINGWRQRAKVDSIWREEQLQKARQYIADYDDANSYTN